MAKQWHQLERLDHKSLKKLQQERDKAVAGQKQEAENKRRLIFAGLLMIALLCAGAFFALIRNRSAQRAFIEERAKLLKYTVIEASGPTFCRALGDWEKVSKGFSFERENTFKTDKEGLIVVELQLKNLLKLASGSEMILPPPTLDEKENKIIREVAMLTRGEITVAVALDGREIIEVEAGGVVALGASGLYKVLFNQLKESGEVVVKNGLVEVFSRKNPDKRIKVSGFYKITFSKGQISNPTQASVIQYDWR